MARSHKKIGFMPIFYEFQKICAYACFLGLLNEKIKVFYHQNKQKERFAYAGDGLSLNFRIKHGHQLQLEEICLVQAVDAFLFGRVGDLAGANIFVQLGVGEA